MYALPSRKSAPPCATPESSQFGGPRQSGKTTLARRFAKQGRTFVTLDNQSTLAAANE
jgi:predicted AAA+ superfamily ATPase